MRVLNKRRDHIPADAVYIDRTTKWGNPYIIGRDGDRATVIARYRRWIWRTLQDDPDFLAPLVGRDLVCHCAPLRCHGDILIAAIAWRYRPTRS
jgi:hypothetical protein